MSCCEEMRKQEGKEHPGKQPKIMVGPSGRWQKLIVKEAEDQGGFPEAVARKFFAPYWGSPDKLTVEQAAQFFGVTPDAIRDALMPVTIAAAAKFNRTPEAATLKNPRPMKPMAGTG